MSDEATEPTLTFDGSDDVPMLDTGLDVDTVVPLRGNGLSADPRAVAAARGLEFVELEVFAIDSAVALSLPEALCRRHIVLPIAIRDDRLVLAMADPGNVFALDDVRTITGREVEPVFADRDRQDYVEAAKGLGERERD
ncbi:MAG: hypothetical protein ACKOKE_03540, partial [Actinomycetota bacterium]